MTDDEMNNWNQNIIAEFRQNNGVVGGMFAGAPILLLTTTGAKSGKQRTTPLVYLPDSDRMLIFASKAGAPTNPDWYHNLVANPVATVEVGSDSQQFKATVITGAERDRLYAQQAAKMPNFAEYEKLTTRTIPVVALTRVA